MLLLHLLAMLTTLRTTVGYRLQKQPEEGQYFEGDIVLARDGAKVVRDTDLLWPSGVVPFEIDGTSNFKDSEILVILNAIRTFNAVSCVQWVTRTKPTEQLDYVIFRKMNGCFSAVGRQTGAQELSLGDGCTGQLGTVLHEMLHAVGFWHEQSRFDRDRYVTVVLRNVQPGMAHNFEKNTLLNTNEIAPYDYNSIMHYSRTAFSKNTQQTLEPLVDGAVIGNRANFSEIDIFELRKLYNCILYDLETVPDTLQPPDPKLKLVQLPHYTDFESGWGGYYQEYYNEELDWSRGILTTPSDLTGPDTDKSGAGIYAFVEASSPARYQFSGLLYSPRFISFGIYCVEFYFHMYGNDMGTLTLVEYNLSEEQSADLVTVSGDQGRRWIKQEVTAHTGGTLRVGFRSTIGLGYKSDAAIDEVTIRDGDCSIPQAPPEPTQKPPQQMDPAAIVGIVGGSIVGVGIILALALYFIPTWVQGAAVL